MCDGIDYKNDSNLVKMYDSNAHHFVILAALIWGNKTPIVVGRRVDFTTNPNWLSKYKYNYRLVKIILCVSNAIKLLTEPVEEEIKTSIITKYINEHISFTVFKKDIPDISPELDIFLITSETEGLRTSVIDTFF